MSAPLSPRQEAFAKALARGADAGAASKAAGYGGGISEARMRAADPAIAARLAAMRAAPARGESPLPAPPARPRFGPLSDEAWLAKYAPRR